MSERLQVLCFLVGGRAFAIDIMGIREMSVEAEHGIDLIPNSPLVTEEMLAGLPEPAQRYLRYAGVVGRPLVDTVRIRQRCRMRPAPNGMSFPLVAEQWYRVEPPGFVWDATVPVGCIPVVRGRDGYLDGHGLMTIKGGSLIPFVDASGPEMDRASLLRHLSEMPWFPSAFLRERVTWEPIDDSTVRVTLADGDLRATGTLEIDAEGRLDGDVFILGGGDKSRLHEEVAAIMANPGAFLDDALRKDFAKALLNAPPPPPTPPACRSWKSTSCARASAGSWAAPRSILRTWPRGGSTRKR